MAFSRHGGEDWRSTLRNASFRGTHFWVEKDGVAGGRRIAIHEFPLSELPYNEDLGQQARRYEVDAYVVGGQAGSQAKALVAACTAKGPANLVLPLFGTIPARCLEIHTNRQKDRHGFVSFTLRFIADTLSLSSMGGAPHAKSRVKTKALAMPAAMKAAFARNYRGVGVADYVLKAAQDLAAAYLGEWTLILDQSLLTGESASSIYADVSSLFGTYEDMLASGQIPNVFKETAYWANGISVSTDPFADAVVDLTETYVGITAPNLAVDGLITMLDFTDGETLEPIPQTTLSRKLQAANRDSLLDLFRRSALAQLAVAVTEVEYPSRRDAVAARAMVAERFGAEIETMRSGQQWEITAALRELQGLTIEYLSQLIADLAPVVEVEAAARMPSMYWAYRLYADATRSDEVATRNRVKHPSWMPTNFEALAR